MVARARRTPVTRAGAAALALLLAAAPAVVPVPAGAAPADDPAKLVDAYFKARKDEDRARARKGIDDAPPLDPKAIPALRDRILEAMEKAGRKVAAKGRDEWFDEKKDGWKGLYMAGGSGRTGLVLALHGGGAGAGDAGQAQGSFSGPIGALKMRGLYPEVLRKTEYGWTDPPETERWVMELVRRARVTFGTDPNRVYVTGHSMGGYGTWTYGSIYADQFAAGAAFAGAPTVYWKPGQKDKDAEAVVTGYIPSLYNLPLFVYQSLDDLNVPAAANIRAAAELKAAHESDPDGWKFVYEQVDGMGHDFPKKGPGPGLQWMASHARDPRPKRIVWQPVREWKTTFYWIRWGTPWLESVLRATLDREANRVDILLERPRAANAVATEKQREEMTRTLSVYVDERVLDPAREIVITVDGKERYRGRPEPRLAVLLRSCEEREDPEYAFAMEAVVGEAAPEARTR